MRNKEFWLPFIGGGLVIIPSSWFLYGEDIFKFTLCAYLLIVAVVNLEDYIKNKRKGPLIFMAFCIFTSLTLFITLYDYYIFTILFSNIAILMFIALIYTFFKKDKYYLIKKRC
ncbi:hypothetical protein AYK20_08550 [Thermoplasmatales archaeon SG8-52-1]|nr:MAG: hypothetical protein AYK20_08550 [Thermoplasmatales archaeon SG8-52-1]